MISQPIPTVLGRIRSRHILLMQQTVDTIGHILAAVSQEQAATQRDARDGPKGWTALEVVCHLRDYDTIFRERAEMMQRQENPALPGYNHELLAQERRYNEQDLHQTYTQLTQSRAQTLAFFEQLGEADWEHTGIHPERGPFTMTDAVVQVGTHDITHLEQLTRILFHNV